MKVSIYIFVILVSCKKIIYLFYNELFVDIAVRIYILYLR